MAEFIEAGTVFKHHQPISIESMQGLTIYGNNGAFRELVSSMGNDPKSPTVGVGVEMNTRGEILGTKLLMCGVLPEVKMNTADLYPGAPEHGKAVFQKADVGNFVMPNGRLTSFWCKKEDNAVNWCIKMQSNNRSKTIKFPKHEEYGFGDTVFRVNVQPTSVSTAKITLGVAPVGGEELQRLQDYNSRKFPTINLTEVRAKIFPQEDENQKLGLGFQPIFIIKDTQPGEVDLDAINYPSSMAVKEACVMMLQGSTKPNQRMNATQWRAALECSDFIAERSVLLWPAPRQEDESSTTDSSASVDTDGEGKIKYLVI